MKRWKHLFEIVIKEETLKQALFDVAVSKKKKERFYKKPSIADKYLENSDKVIANIKRNLNEKTYKVTTKKSFQRRERGKLRTITPPSFYDSIIYHATIISLMPYFEKKFYYYSLGSIPGKGPWVGLNSIKSNLKDDRKHTKYCLQIDVRKFYDSIDRKLLIEKLKRTIKDQDMIWLLDVIINGQPGKGLPLGAYTSGWFANFFLDEIDHFIKQELKVKYYYRYVDDMVLFGPNKKKLHKIRIALDEKLKDLNLEMKGNWQVYKINSRRVDFLGFRTGRNNRIDRKRNMVEFARYTKRHGRKPTPAQASSIESRRGRCRKFDSYTFLKSRIEPYTSRSYNRRVLRYDAKRNNERKRLTFG